MQEKSRRQQERRRNDYDNVDRREKYKTSFIKFRLIRLALFALAQRILISTVLMVFLVDRNVEDVDFVVNFVVDILFFLLNILLVIPRLTLLELLESVLQSCVLFSHLIDYLEQLFNLKSFLVFCFGNVMTMQLLFEPIDLYFFLINHSVLHLRKKRSTFSIFSCY